jgi:hypothetical protein
MARQAPLGGTVVDDAAVTMPDVMGGVPPRQGRLP